jgi:hypothetical protein
VALFPATADLSGQWNGFQGAAKSAITLILSQRQNEVTGTWRGTIQDSVREVALDEGRFDPETKQLSFRLKIAEQPVPFVGTLAADGNSITGTYQGQYPWQVTRRE